jgi:hypothetical protein
MKLFTLRKRRLVVFGNKSGEGEKTPRLIPLFGLARRQNGLDRAALKELYGDWTGDPGAPVAAQSESRSNCRRLECIISSGSIEGCLT